MLAAKSNTSTNAGDTISKTSFNNQDDISIGDKCYRHGQGGHYSNPWVGTNDGDDEAYREDDECDKEEELDL